MPPGPVAELIASIANRRTATFTLERPSGKLNGVSIDLFLRAGEEHAPEFVGDVPMGVFQPLTIAIPARLMKAGPETFVEASFVLKQPAGMSGQIRFKGRLEMGDLSADAAVSVSLAVGDLGGLVDLTWWVVEA